MNKNNFDFIRFGFAIIVMWEHIIALAQNKRILYLESFFDSYSSVTGFFIISGFLITKSYKSTNTLADYLIKRAKRLLPAYLFSILIFSIFCLFFSKYSISEYFSNKQFYKYVIANITFLNFLKPDLPGVFTTNPHTAVNGALWTIKVEVMFYLTLPLVLSLIDKYKKKIFLMGIIYGSSIVYKALLSSDPESILGFLGRQTPGFYSYFIVGISFFYYYNFYEKNIEKILIFTLPLFAIEYYYGLEIFRPFCFGTLIYFAAYKFSSLNNFGKFGDFSYGIYIYHWPIIQIFVYCKFFDEYNPYAVSILLNFIILFVAMLSWNYIEKPFLKRRKHSPAIYS